MSPRLSDANRQRNPINLCSNQFDASHEQWLNLTYFFGIFGNKKASCNRMLQDDPPGGWIALP